MPDGGHPRLLHAKVIHRGRWEGLGEMYDLRIGRGKFATIIVTPTEVLQEKVKLTLQKFGVAVDSIELSEHQSEKRPARRNRV